MPEGSINSTSIDLEKDIRVDQQASSNGCKDDGKSSVPSPMMNHSSEEIQAIEPKGVSEPDPIDVLTKVLSRTISRISIDPGPPPDGGLVAWTQVLMGHLIVFNTWGYIISFGVFQTYYVATLGHPPSDISWVRTSAEDPLQLVGDLQASHVTR